MNLDYTIYSDKDRTKYITDYLVCHSEDYAPNQKTGYTATQQRELQQMADYILFGKDPEKLTNAVQRKEIAKPATKYSTYARKEPESLEELMETPGFGQLEANLNPANQKNIYLHPKPTINHNYIAGSTPNAVCPYAAKCPLGRNCAQTTEDKTYACDTWIPGMIDLWDSIATHQHWIAVANKKELPQNDAEKKMQHWTPLELYRQKHWLTELRKQQYQLKQGYKKTITGGITLTTPGTIDWNSDSGYWEENCPPPQGEVLQADPKHPSTEEYDYYLGEDKKTRYRKGREGIPYIADQWDRFKVIREHTLDFTNSEHIYYIINLYRALLVSSYDDLNGQMKWILMTFDEIVDRTILSDVQCEILNYRILNWTNDRIAAAIEQEFGHIYNPNYISFIFKTHICTKIAKTAALMEREFAAKDNPDAWKKCTCCGELLLIDDFNFVHKYVTKDGYAARCKRCDSLIRKQTRAKTKEATDGQ